MSNRTHRPRTILTGSAVAVCLVAALGGCGDDDGPETSDTTDETAAATGAAGEGQAYCDAYLAISTDQGPAVDFESATEAEIIEAMAAYATAFEPKLAAIEAEVPADVTEAVAAYTGTYREVLETGDDSAFDDDYLAAEKVVVDAAIDSCAVDVIEATAVDYAYQGIPATVDSGRVGFRLANEGTEVHEAVVYRRADGATGPVEEILALSEDEQAELIEFVGWRSCLRRPTGRCSSRSHPATTSWPATYRSG